MVTQSIKILKRLPGRHSAAAVLVLSLAVSARADDNVPPPGFTALFNGHDLSGWKVPEGDGGHWKVVNGAIDYDAQSEAAGDKSLWLEREFVDFELHVDWRIKEAPYTNPNVPYILPDGTHARDIHGQEMKLALPDADSGIYLRGSATYQVNIWCWPIGSGEMYGIRTNPRTSPELRAAVTPRTQADHPVGEWNRFEITVRGNTVQTFLNGKLVIPRQDPRPAATRSARLAAPRRQAEWRVGGSTEFAPVQEHLYQGTAHAGRSGGPTNKWRPFPVLLSDNCDDIDGNGVNSMEALMSEALTGKVAVITGGATGIGKAVATRLAAAGDKVLIAGRDHVRGKTSAYDLAKHGYEVRFLRTDVRIENAISGLFDQAIELYGGLDFLFNNAGIEGVLGPISQNTEEIVEDVLSINVKGVFLAMKQILPVFTRQGGGVIVNTSSFVGTVMPFPDAVLLGATEAAVISMTQSVAAGFGSENIRVFAVCPWLTDTPMVDRLTHHQAEMKSRLAGMNPSGMAASPEDVANVVLSMFAGDPASCRVTPSWSITAAPPRRSSRCRCDSQT